MKIRTLLTVKSKLISSVMFVIILLAGLYYVNFTLDNTKSDLIKRVLKIAQTTETALPFEKLLKLGAVPEDSIKPEYAEIKFFLKEIIKINNEARFAYLYTMREGKLYFIADSEPENSVDYSPPGQPYSEAGEDYFLPFQNRKEHITNPSTDRWGTWVSVLIPIQDRQSGETIAVFSMDYDAGSWTRSIIIHVVQAGIISAAFLLLFFFAVNIYTKNTALKSDAEKQKLLQNELQDKKNELENFFNLSLDLMCIADLSGNFLKVSKAWEEILGYPVEELEKKQFLEFVHPDDIASTLDAMAILSDQKPVVNLTNRYLRKDGTYRYIEWRSKPSGDLVYAAARDITKRINTEEALKKSEERLKNVIEGTNIGTWEWNVQTGETIFNERWADIIGYTLQELSPVSIQTWLDHTNKDDLQISSEQLKLVFDKVITHYDVDCRMRHKNGRWVWVQDRGKVIEWTDDGKPLIMIGTHSDITERKKAEEALRLSEVTYRGMLNEITELIFIQDENSAFIDLNESAVKTYGYDREFLIGKTPEVLSADGMNDLNKINETLKNAFAGAEAKFEFWGKTNNGRIFPTEVYLTPGTYFGKKSILAVARDITDRKQADYLLRQIRANYETFFNTIDDFLFVLDEQGNMIHVNDTVIKRLGYSKEELSGKSVLMVHPEERRAEAGRIVGEMLQGKAEFCPVPIITKSGSQIPVETKVTQGTWDSKPALFGVSKDISQIQLSEEKFSKVFYLNPSACGLSNLGTGEYFEVNDAFYSLLGFEKNEVIGKTPMELNILTKEARETILKKAESKERVVNIETDLRAKNGDIKHVLLSAENIYIQDKKFRYTVVHDITEHKKAEERVRQIANELEIILSTADAGISHIKGREIVWANNAHEEMFGYEPGESIGKTTADFYPDASSFEKLGNEAYPVLAAGGTYITEMEMKKKSGEKFWCSLTGTQVNISNPDDGSIWIIQNISERKRIEKEIKENEKYLNAVFNVVGSGIIIINSENQSILDINETAVKMIGLPREEILGKLCHNFICPNEIGNCPVKDLNTSIDNCERILLTAKGEEKEIIKTVYRMPYKGIDCYIESFMDISELKRKEEELKKLIEELNFTKNELEERAHELVLTNAELDEALVKADAANIAKSMFIANVSHEIRTPMNAILGFSEILLSRITEPVSKGYLNTILSSGKSLLVLINDILDLSKIEAGRMEPELLPVNLKNLIADLMALFSFKAEEKNLELMVNYPSSFPKSILIDDIRVRQILVNIVGNSVKFTNEGFVAISIKLDAFHPDSKELDFSISVEDTGIGVSEEDRQIIFEPFRQAASKAAKNISGTGLGLAISNRLAKLLGGSITVQSIVGKGSVFTLALKNITYSDEEIYSQLNHELETNSIHFNEGTILIADDLEQNIDVLKGFLSNQPFKIIVGSDGKEAVELSEKYKPDIVIMDIRMPELDGISATKLLKNIDETKSIPVIAFTASLPNFKNAEYLGVFDDILVKPVSKYSLYSLLMKYFTYIIIDTGGKDTADDLRMKIASMETSGKKELLSELDKLEEKFLKKTIELSEIFDLEEISRLISDLDDYLKSNGIILMDEYINKLKTAGGSFDIEMIQKLLSQFSDSIEILRRALLS